MLQEHVCTAECGEGGAVARVPDRPRAHVQQVQEEDRQEVPGGRTVRHVHLQQVSTVLYLSQMKLSWKLLKICKEISLFVGILAIFELFFCIWFFPQNNL